MMLKVWLYGYALGMTSSRRLEQRIRIKEGRCVRGRKKQARRGRKLNVSPVRTLLPRGAGWRIALYAVFRKENRTRDPLQRSQGGSKGQGWVSGNPTSRSARGAALDSSQHVFGVVGYASLFQECQELLLECHLLVTLALIADLGGYLIELRRTHAEGSAHDNRFGAAPTALGRSWD
jgi:hypothetical protein